MAECILNARGNGRFQGYSAGSRPTGQVNRHAIALLQRLGHPVARLRSKSWDEFADPDAPRMDRVITVCDNAAGEVCPVWPGHPAVGHWSLPDPAAVAGDDAEMAAVFAATYRQIQDLIDSLVTGSSNRLDPE